MNISYNFFGTNVHNELYEHFTNCGPQKSSTTQVDNNKGDIKHKRKSA
jgi:hypothetical protein